MIIILFPGGSFGSTLEYCVRNFSQELTKISAEVLPDGSMHSYKNEFHPVTFEEFSVGQYKMHPEIVTPVYPTLDAALPGESIKQWTRLLPKDAKIVIVYFDNIKQYERNTLFGYYKIPKWLDVVLKDKPKSWNPTHQSWHDMEPWELREALSFYIDQSIDYKNIESYILDSYLKVTTDNILFDLPNTLKTIIKFCNLTLIDENLDTFYFNWLSKQQYILKEFDTIEKIFQSLKINDFFAWEKLSVVGEAIIQSRLRQQNIGLKCHSLVDFPCNTDQLKTYFE